MTSFVNQFHATLEEHINFVKDVLDKYGVYAIAVDHPFQATVVPPDSVKEALSSPSVWRVVFTESPPDLSSVATGTQLLDKNNGSLVLNIGKFRNGSLEESSLSTMNASPTWKKINKLFKSRAKAGVIGTHDETGTSKFYHDHRLTAGAMALSEQGTELRQYAQTPIVYRPGNKPAKP